MSKITLWITEMVPLHPHWPLMAINTENRHESVHLHKFQGMWGPKWGEIDKIWAKIVENWAKIS